ncbi:TPA: autotransporter outer membrane beta-barrel domain-containing protein, partial [Escherichia coli]|nr:autotransporter outer membrane beta-barrel domain-containing protein [Escherichia coli]
MNKIYMLKKNHRGELVAVSEVVKNIKRNSISTFLLKSKLSTLLLISIMVGGYSFPSCASVVSSTTSYQTYRDFAENKGEFRPGAENVPLYDKNGNPVTTLNKAPMIDFSSNDSTGVATLVSPQYVVSVKHNGGYQYVKFGYADDSSYALVDRNNHWRDFHTPRLNKIVTEVTPLDITNAGTAKGTYQNADRFPVFYRVGTGTQYVKDTNGKITYLMGAYSYKTGGIVNTPAISDWSFVTNTTNTPLSTYGTPGDSGSPLFAWDADQNKWVLLAVLNSYAGVNGNTNWYTIIPAGDVKNTMKQDADAPVNTKQGEGDIHWSYDEKTGLGSLTQGSTSWEMHGNLGATWPASLNSGKDLTFQGGGTVVLENTVNQGAGTLTFDDDYIVKPVDTQTWKGGGIIVNGEHLVDWQINGVTGDSLHKLGTGTLKINGTGVNPGSLNVGDGTVILAQRADDNGLSQAFSSVSIVSGRPTLVLNDDKQINPDNIKWGYHGGKLDINGNSLTFHKLNGADDGAILTNSGSMANVNLDFNSPDTTATIANIWHGHFTGNLNINNEVTAGTQNDFAIDGGVNAQGSITQQNGRLFMQGHPVVHAVSSQDVANKLKALGDNSVLTQPVSFTQNDWENRQFSMAELNLQNAEFNLARNASLNTRINADHSTVTLGSEDLYIDLNDGNGVATKPTLGKSKATAEDDQSRFNGHVQLKQGSALTINEHFIGDIDSTDSATTITSTDTTLNQLSRFTQSSLSLGEGAKLTATAGLLSDGTVSSNAGASLSLLSDQPGTMYSAQSWELSGQDTNLNVGAGGIITGDINANDAASIIFGTTDINQSTNYYGNINAPLASITMKDTAWQANKQSVVKSLTLNGSTLSFNRFGQGGLTSDTLEATNSSFIINADGKAADTVTVNQALTGANNTLVVIPTTNSVKQGGDPVALVTAPKNTQSDIFTLNPVSINAGFHSFTPQLDVLETDVNKQWRLEGFYIQPDKAALRTGKSFMDLGYKNFLTEINNLNDRMGDLRHTHGETGAWARLNSGSGSATDGFTGSYTHLQIGADRKHIIEGGELFTGVTATFTNSNNRGTGWSGRTKSTGIGVYASAMFDSGLYVDTIGKYVRHDNHYSSSALGMPEQDYGSHSWYLGAEAGWRFSLPDETYIQPQTELIYGTVSENQFAWQFNGGEVYMQRKQMQPLIGRTGIEFGKTFSGKDWEMTALTGINYQYDLFKPTVTAFKDLAGDTYINNGKDSRVVFNVGLNTKIKENTRISLNVERSEFGSYNIDKLINANI